MSRSKFQAVPVGRHCLDVGTWNPATRGGEQTFSYIDIGALDQESKAIRAISPIACDQAPSRARQIVRSGDILVSTVRPNLNAVAVVPDGLDGATASTGFCVLRPDPNHCDGRYLFHWVRSPIFIEAMVRLATGASYPAVSDRIVKESVLPLPPLPEQRRIAAILDQAEALHAKRRAALAKLDTLAQGIFIEMFGDPAISPSKWSYQELGSIFEIARGGSPRPIDDYITEAADGMNWITISDASAGSKYITATRRKIRQEGVARSRVVHPGDFLLTNSMSFGRPYILRTTGCIHDGWLVLSPRANNIDANYLFFALSSPFVFSEFVRRASGATVKNLNIDLVRSVTIPVPPMTLQHEFLKKVAQIEDLQGECLISLASLDRLFASLQHRAFRGEL